MKNLFFIFIVLFSFSCEKDRCKAGKIPFGDECIKEGDYTFYFGKADFYCYPDSVAIGIDNNKSMYIVYAFTNEFTNILSLLSEGPSSIHPSSNVLLEDCEDNDNTTYENWHVMGRFDDIAALKNDPQSIKLNLYLKYNFDFDSKTLDSTSIVLKRR